MGERKPIIEWPTLILLITTYAVWIGAVFWISNWSLALGRCRGGPDRIAQQSSLAARGAAHGHPSPLAMAERAVGAARR